MSRRKKSTTEAIWNSPVASFWATVPLDCSTTTPLSLRRRKNSQPNAWCGTSVPRVEKAAPE